MNNFHLKILRTEGSDIDEWRTLVSRHPQGDIYFTPEYVMTFQRTTGATRTQFGGEAQLLFYGNEQNYIIYPFLKRGINKLPFAVFLSLESKNWFDIVSPYGYSGPLAYVSDPSIENCLWEGFMEELHAYCLENNIVAEFARLHPYIMNHLPLNEFANVINLERKSEVIYINLEQDESLIRKSMTKGSKSSATKARRSGVEIRHCSASEEIDTFHKLYITTMEKNKANEAYFFSRDFINDTFQLLGENVKLFSAWYEDRIIAASLFLFYRGNLSHYYLSGSDANFLSLCPNNLLLYEAILYAKGQGYKTFNLGGGYGLNDSLFQFKASFSKTTLSFYTYSRIHNESLYKQLCEARKQYAELAQEEIVQSNYFPAYRK